MRYRDVAAQRRDFSEFYRASRDVCLRAVLATVGDRDIAEDLVAEPGQVGGVPAGAARRVERPPRWYPVKDLPHQRLLDVDLQAHRLRMAEVAR